MNSVILGVLITLAPVGPDTCLAPGQDRMVEMRVDLGDFPAGMIGYQFFVQFDEGLIPVRREDASLCDPAWCCNGCNGADIFSPRPELGPGVYAFGHASVGCATCGTSCDGAHGDVQLARWWVRADANYAWPPGESHPSVHFFYVGNPHDEGIFTCCAGQTSVPCDACGGQCHWEPFTQGSGFKQGVCLPPNTGIGDREPAGVEPSTWGRVKAGE